MSNDEQVGMIRELALALLEEVELLASAGGPAAPPNCDADAEAGFYELIEAYEKFLIRRALVRARGNQARAARLLRLKPTTLHRKMKVYDIKAVEEGRRAPAVDATQDSRRRLRSPASQGGIQRPGR